MAKPIPPSVRDLLKQEWQDQKGYSAFDAVFKEGHRRQRDPSYYIIRESKKVETDMDTLSHAEAVALVKDGVFGGVAAVRDDGTAVINEHAQHALTDFCSEVYVAWRRYQERLRMVQAACPVVGSDED